MKNKFRSDLSVAKNTGSSGHGSCHWLAQRVTALILAFFTAFMAYISYKLAHASGNREFVAILADPYNIIILSVFFITALYHATMGVQVVIEDYIHCRPLKVAGVISIQVFAFITIIGFVTALIYLMNWK